MSSRALARRLARLERRRRAANEVLRRRGQRLLKTASATLITTVLRSAGITGELR